MFADKSLSFMHTTGNCSNLLETKTIKVFGAGTHTHLSLATGDQQLVSRPVYRQYVCVKSTP